MGKHDAIEVNSTAREDRITELTKEKTPQNLHDVLTMIGDTGDSRFPIWRNGRFPDFWATMSVGRQNQTQYSCTGIHNRSFCTASVSLHPTHVNVFTLTRKGKTSRWICFNEGLISCRCLQFQSGRTHGLQRKSQSKSNLRRLSISEVTRQR